MRLDSGLMPAACNPSLDITGGEDQRGGQTVFSPTKGATHGVQ